MSSARLFSPLALQAGCRFKLDSGQSRYLGGVLRLRVGDSISLFDGTGGEYEAILVSLGKNEAEVETGEHRTRSVESRLAIQLVQAISRGDRMDLLVQKATELGVARITPVLSVRSVVRIDAKRAVSRRERWQKIAQSACEQCGRNVVPRVDDVVKLNDWHNDNPANGLPRLVLHPQGRSSLSSIECPEKDVTVLIGPEGGFSEAEYNNAVEAGFESICLGPRVLRTETAAIAVVAAMQTLWGDLTEIQV
jgi:16S rRNA (uracil1498-N3)-methyltransferase